jgi:hypothetical protein
MRGFLLAMFTPIIHLKKRAGENDGFAPLRGKQESSLYLLAACIKRNICRTLLDFFFFCFFWWQERWQNDIVSDGSMDQQ